MREQKRDSARNLNIDLIRAAACFLVISVHFFPNTGYYLQDIQGMQMFILTTIRNFSMICVPMFMILTGYLSGHFVYDKKHILRFVHVLIVYFLSTLVCQAFRVCCLGSGFSVKGLIYGLIDFSGAPYAWYVEMYLGLLIMIPFLNAGWRSLNEAGRRMTLLGFLALTGAHTILPDRKLFDYWAALYPLTYYFVGAFLADKAIRIRKRTLALLLAAAALGLGGASYIRDYGAAFRALPYNDHASVYVFAVTLLFFLLLLRLDLSALPAAVRGLIRAAGKATLPAYLVSYCFDCSFYEPLCRRVPLAADQLPYYFLLVPMNFMGSLIIGHLIMCLSNVIFRPVQLLANRIPFAKR